MSGSFPALPQIQPFQAPNLMALSNAVQEQSMNAMRERQLFGAEQEKNALRRYLADPTVDLTSPDAARKLLEIAPTTGAATYQALLRGYADKRAAEASVRAGTASSAAATASTRQAELTNLNIQKANFDLAQRGLVGIGNLPDEEKPTAWTAWRAETERAVPWTRGRIPRDYSPAAYRDALLTAQGVADRITAEAKPPADYTIGQTRYSGATNQPIATAEVRPADYTIGQTRYSGATNQPIAAAEVRDTAREAKIRSIMETQNVPLQIAAGIADGVLVPITDPVTGQTRMFNKATNTYLESTPAPAAPVPAPVPVPASLVAGPRAGLTPPPATAEAAPDAPPTAAAPPAAPPAAAQPTLYDLAQIPMTTGLGPAAGEFLQRGLGQVGINVVSPEFTARRQRFETAKNEALRAWALNTRFPVAEMERILKDYDITAAKFTDPQTLVTNIRNATSELRRRLANEERAGSDLNLPVSERQQARISANNIANFLKLLGGPEEPLAPQAPDRAPRARNTLNRQTQTGARPPAAAAPQRLRYNPQSGALEPVE